MRSVSLICSLMLVFVATCIPCIAFGAEEGTSQEKIKQLYNQAHTFEKRGDTARAIPLYKEASQYKEAIAVLQDALQRNEEDQSKKVDVSRVYNNLGNVYRAQGAYDKAIPAFQKALSLDRNMAGPNLNIGITYDVHQKMPEKAIPFYLKKIEIAPNERTTYEAYLNLGIYY